ncbi:MAG: hypothetical protein IJW86_03245 [Clostridia bacterium]|nr:hypothetical protein [Clostridia bacterium]
MRDFYGRVPERRAASGTSEDTALIIALMLLLKSEHCDPMLIFALLYILS